MPDLLALWHAYAPLAAFLVALALAVTAARPAATNRRPAAAAALAWTAVATLALLTHLGIDVAAPTAAVARWAATPTGPAPWWLIAGTIGVMAAAGRAPRRRRVTFVPARLVVAR